MKHLQGLKTSFNQVANGLRLIGMILMTAGAIGLVADSANIENGFDFYKQAMLHVVVAGVILGSVGEGLWKMLLRHSDVTKRQFYFYDEK